MAGKRKSSTRPWLVGIMLGVGGSICWPYVEGHLRAWIGQIVVEAVHMHWQWEQSQRIFIPG